MFIPEEALQSILPLLTYSLTELNDVRLVSFVEAERSI